MTEIIGWYGVVAILSAYVLNTWLIITSDSLAYSILNLTGALSVAYISYKKRNKQPLVLNIVWAMVAATALFKLLF